MQRVHSLVRDQRGAAAIEFAIAAPLLLALIIGILQLGLLFFANAGVTQAVEEGARYATIYPNPSDTAIIARVNQQRFGMSNGTVTGPTVSHGTTNGVRYVDVSMSYAVPLNFVFFETPPVTVSHQRRAFQP